MNQFFEIFNLFFFEKDYMALIPPLLKRVQRCNNDDINVIIHLWKTTTSTLSPSPSEGLITFIL